MNHAKKEPGKKAMKHLHPKAIAEKDETLLNELKRIKKLQKGLYKEYEISDWGEEEED